MTKFCMSGTALKRVGAVVSVFGLASTSAHAASTIDLTSITGAITATDVTVGILAIGAVLATIYATQKAAKMALAMLRGG